MSGSALGAREVTARWARVADGFGARVERVPPDGWAAPSPCEGWAARDIVAHLVEWVPPFLDAGAGVDLGSIPDAREDPAGAWRALRTGIDGVLADPDLDRRRFSHPRAGDHPLADAIDTFVLGDVLIHTWDLARATGQDETLDRELVHESLLGYETLEPGFLAASGQYAPAVPVPDGADEQTRMLALTGRVV